MVSRAGSNASARVHREMPPGAAPQQAAAAGGQRPPGADPSAPGLGSPHPSPQPSEPGTRVDVGVAAHARPGEVEVEAGVEGGQRALGGASGGQVDRIKQQHLQTSGVEADGKGSARQHSVPCSVQASRGPQRVPCPVLSLPIPPAAGPRRRAPGASSRAAHRLLPRQAAPARPRAQQRWRRQWRWRRRGCPRPPSACRRPASTARSPRAA